MGENEALFVGHAGKKMNCGLRWTCVICLSWVSICDGSLMKVRTTIYLSHNSFCLSRSLPLMRSCLLENFFARQLSSNWAFLYGHTTFLLFSQAGSICFHCPHFLLTQYLAYTGSLFLNFSLEFFWNLLCDRKCLSFNPWKVGRSIWLHPCGFFKAVFSRKGVKPCFLVTFHISWHTFSLKISLKFLKSFERFENFLRQD